jgi:predicted Zn-ribbon and HTH transcriptional regulator
MEQSQQLTNALSNSTAIVCQSCQNPTFIEVTYLRKISKILTGNKDDTLIPVPTFACSKCGCVNDEFKLNEPSPILQL